FVAAIPLVSKGDVFSALSGTINIEAKRIGYYPSVLHSDQGTEFINSEFKKYCRDHIIRQWISDEYNPQQIEQSYWTRVLVPLSGMKF
ncbi:hypothetical protein VP01_7671g1, partial [Puccinia sorghi]